MIFNSLSFLAFLAVTLVVYYNLGFRPQNLFLLFASYFFYSCWDWRFLFLLVFTTAFDYGCAIAIEGQRHQAKKRLLLACSIIINMGVLCAFKYFNFFAGSFSVLLNALGMKASAPTLHLVLPLGISFYTFLSMSYTIDVYRGQMKATRDPIAFGLFLAFFPHLVAGPIVRASCLLPQCERPRQIKAEQVTNGIWLILLGYVKKVVIADRLCGLVDWGFANHGVAPFPNANSWIVLYAFAFQIYGDFAGYSDIARGLAKIMGFELPLNFRAPYLVTSPSQFWRHWHMTLSTWLRDYVYIPMGGNRKGSTRTCINLMNTMLLGGLWHGAGVAYVLWGAYHGALLIMHRGGQQLRSAFTFARPAHDERWPAESVFVGLPRPQSLGIISRSPIRLRDLGRVLAIILFFHVICLGWLLFRAGSLPVTEQFHSIATFLNALFRPISTTQIAPWAQPVILLGGVALLLQSRWESMERFASWSTSNQVTAVVAAISSIATLGVFQGTQFIYFQF